jgi:hypothetical protein
MQIEDVKTWMWMVAGALAGLVFSAVLTWSGPWFDAESMDTVDAATFEHALLGRLIRHAEPALAEKYHKGQPLVRNLVVHPPIYNSTTPTRYWVTGELYSIRPQFKDPKSPAGPMVIVEQWVPFKYAAEQPYIAWNGANGVVTGNKGTPYPNVIAYLKALQQKDKAANFTYKFAWPETKQALWTLPPLAGLLIIGIAWPTALGAMQSFGMARPPKPAEKPKKPAPKPAAVKPVPGPVGVRVVAPPTPQPAPVGDSKHYGGEFYPVVKPVHHD